MADKDLYGVLGVSKDASQDEIKKAFRRKARELHPDVNKAEDAEERFKELNEAYDVLSDKNKRAQYDQFGTVGSMGGFGGGGYQYVDVNDIFGGFGMDDIFSTFFGGGGAGRAAVREEGRDMQVGLRITLEEAAVGAKKDVIYDRLAPCEECAGSGLGSGGSIETCQTCQGRGRVTTYQRTILGSMQSSGVCPDCGGSGKTITNPCPECEGQGRVPDREHVSVDVPAGIQDGQQLRVSGFGEAGMRGAPSGNLLVSVVVQPHEFFERDRNDLHCKATVSITQAALGAELHIKGIMPDEDVVCEVPQGSQYGDVVTVPQKGMPLMRTDERGNLRVHLEVKVPTQLNDHQRELMTELAESLGDEISDTRSGWQKFKDKFN